MAAEERGTFRISRREFAKQQIVITSINEVVAGFLL